MVSMPSPQRGLPGEATLRGLPEAERDQAEDGEELWRSPWFEGMSGQGGIGVWEELRC